MGPSKTLVSAFPEAMKDSMVGPPEGGCMDNVARVTGAGRRAPWAIAIGFAALALLLGTIVATADDPAGRDREDSRQLVGTWSASPQLAGAFPIPFATGFTDQTIREIVHSSVGGGSIRLRLSNTFGPAPLTF